MAPLAGCAGRWRVERKEAASASPRPALGLVCSSLAANGKQVCEPDGNGLQLWVSTPRVAFLPEGLKSDFRPGVGHYQLMMSCLLSEGCYLMQRPRFLNVQICGSHHGLCKKIKKTFKVTRHLFSPLSLDFAFLSSSCSASSLAHIYFPLFSSPSCDTV